ncbi:PIG-L family deacetylase [Psychroflexus aestuariivivens]|uniref:PIG-L family deacetylase n=1 Tax=Psychroflexus aestuariivivens TaxID=1795040 RepID=UPI000FDC88E2|nr:PIG-L family deacetylase [Psychroflexus aestuariivivens]
MRRILCLIPILLFTFILKAQAPEKPTASEIYQQIQSLNFLGNVLYLAAHPDDENTSLITYFSKYYNANTAYLSLTRGDGGQNLIGPDIGKKLGIIRTQELLQARKIDGGKQFFSRAKDFGYSKTPEETLDIWNKDKILADVVRVLRKFRPDIVINRFDHRTSGSTHGHHTTSALLSVEAFDLSNQQQIYTNQLERLKPWQPKRLYFNTSPWFYGSQEAFEAADKSNFTELNVNQFYPVEGLSNNEIAALSRSQHKSQGFGNTGSRGDKIEYLELVKGEMNFTQNPFEGINTTWTRIPEGKAIGEILNKVEDNYNFKKPWKSIPKLMQALGTIEEIEDNFWREQKLAQIKKVISSCLGLFAEAKSSSAYANPGDSVAINFEIINRSPVDVNLKSISLNRSKSINVKQISLENNADFKFSETIKIPKNSNYTTPYWLKSEGELGVYKVDNPSLIGLPETPEPLNFTYIFEIEGRNFELTKALIYKYNDPVKGEVYENFEILPKVSVAFQESVFTFKNGETKSIRVDVKSYDDHISGRLKLDAPSDWQIQPKFHQVEIEQAGDSKSFTFEVTPTQNSEIEINPSLEISGEKFEQKISEINYDHIGKHFLIESAKAKFINFDIQLVDKKIAYIKGAGSTVAKNLSDLGFEIQTFEAEEINAKLLKDFEVVIIGIRAYNIHKSLAYKQSDLFEFVENGGTMIVQYNTNRGLKLDNVAPYHMKISRDRVTEENAKVTFLNPSHPVLNFPNKIGQADFENWVQERGLYFPDEWSNEFTPVISMNDKNETSKESSILVATYGKGHYVYTGLSFFRELPAGVSGAYKLLVNLIALGNE